MSPDFGENFETDGIDEELAHRAHTREQYESLLAEYADYAAALRGALIAKGYSTEGAEKLCEVWFDSFLAYHPSPDDD